MASKTASKQTSHRSRSKAHKRTPNTHTTNDRLLYYMLLLGGSIVLSVMLLIAVLGFGGAFGIASRYVLFGIFGIFAYVFPFALAGGTLYSISNRQNKTAAKKFLAAIGTYLLTALLLELFIHGQRPLGGLEAFETGQQLHTGGGMVGGFLSGLFVRMFGLVGAYVISFAGLAICLVFLTDNMPINRLQEDSDLRRKNRALRQRERDSERQYQRAQRRIREEEEYRRREAQLIMEEKRRESELRYYERKQQALRKQQLAEVSGNQNTKSSQTSPSGRKPYVSSRGKGISFNTTILPEKTHVSDELNEIILPKEEMADTPENETDQQNIHQVETISKSSVSPEPSLISELHEAQEQYDDNSNDIDSVSEFTSLTPTTSSVAGIPFRDPDEPLGSYFDHANPQEAFIDDRRQTEDREIFSDVPEMVSIPIEGADSVDVANSVKTADPVGAADLMETAEPVEVADFMETAEPVVAVIPDEAAAAISVSHSVEAADTIEVSENPVSPENDLTEDITVSTAENASVTSTENTPAASATDTEEKQQNEYVFPTVDLLTKPKVSSGTDHSFALQETASKLQQTLENFGVKVTITDACCGPTVTRYELQPQKGVKVSKIVNLADDIKLNLAAADIRIEAPIPGKAAIGIEVPNKEAAVVSFRELMESKDFRNTASPIAFAAGRDIAGNIMISDIAKMPHVLIAGATGSGKSVCINTIIMSILYKAHPDDVKFIMIDPKVVELSVYNGIPHLLIPVVTDPKKAAGALHWAVHEMMDRYDSFAKTGVRDMKGYNAKIKDGQIHYDMYGETVSVAAKKLPQIVVIVDELADLMMVASNEVEEAICRLAQLARAAGIHLVIATQRPSVNVITGLIKANMPSRIAFAVTSGVDSRTILDMVGAEKLLGKGDMLYYPQGFTKPLRVQGAFVMDEDVARVVDFIRSHSGKVDYDSAIENTIRENETADQAVTITNTDRKDEKDSYFDEAARLLIEKEKGSIGMLQRYFKVGFNRAARIMDQLEEAGVVGPEEGTKPRKILMTLSQFEGESEDVKHEE